MKEYIYLGSSPVNEPCVQTTDPDYDVKAYDECAQYRAQLLRHYERAHGQPCPVRLTIKRESHDFGAYYEVAALVDDSGLDRATLERHWDAALWLESNAPEKWDTA